MHKFVAFAVATAVSSFAAVGAQAAPSAGGSTTTSNVTVVNTAAAPIPTNVQNVVAVDVLATPPTRARLWTAGCTVSTGAYFCQAGTPTVAPAGMVMKVVGVSGAVNAGCQMNSVGKVTLMGAFKAPNLAEAYTRIFVTGPIVSRPSGTGTVLQYQGNAYFTTLSKAEFALMGPALSCNYANGGEVIVHYVLEPIA